MADDKIVVALGGNALGNTLEELKQNSKIAAKAIVDLAKKGKKIAIVHGNGPQVGLIKNSFDLHSKEKGTDRFPLDLCVALSQGQIGYFLQNAILEELQKREIKQNVATILTQIIVDKDDPAFEDPSKPIGNFLTKEEADKLEKLGLTMMEDSGRGYRQIVASPKPKRIVEIETIKSLLDSNTIVITCGGGAVPVIEEKNSLIGVEAIIDKDFASAKLAELIGAKTLLILTAVEKVALNFARPNEIFLDKLTVKDAEKYLKENQFGKGSMEPKVRASMEFVKNNEKATAIITQLEKAEEAIDAKTGTRIVKE